MLRRGQTLAAIIGIGLLIPTLLYVFPTSVNQSSREFVSRSPISKSTQRLLSGIKITGDGRRQTFAKEIRSRHMEKICKKYKNRLQTQRAKVKEFAEIIYNDQYKVLYCQVPKVATTNWRRMFLILSGQMNTTDPGKLNSADVHKSLDKHLNYLSDLDPQEIQFRLKNYVKFMVVREPFERLLSAYRNKLGAESSKNYYFHTRYGKGIIKKFRKNPSNVSLENGHDVSFREFIEYIIDPERKDRLNGHWAKYHELCLPCFVNYDYILRYESLTEDSDKIIDKLGASDILKFPSRSTAYHLPKTSEFLYDFYKTLPRKIMAKLLDFYHLDFALFNYTLPSVLKNLTRGWTDN